MSRDIFTIDWNQVDFREGLISTGVILAIAISRFVLPSAVFVAAIAAFIVLLVSKHARHRWKVGLLTAIFGAVVTGLAGRVADSSAETLGFVWFVTFIASLTIAFPLLNGVATLVNLWAVVATSDPTTPEESAQAAAAWIAGCLIAYLVIRIRIRRSKAQTVMLPDIDPGEMYQYFPVRRAVFFFATVRATAVAIAGGLGLLIFDVHPWLPATTALVVIGLDSSESFRIARQRAVGTLIGVSSGLLLAGALRETAGQVMLFLFFAFVTVLFKDGNEAIFAAAVTVAIILLNAAYGGQPLSLSGTRVISILGGVGIGLAAIRFAQPAMVRITNHRAQLQANAGSPQSGGL